MAFRLPRLPQNAQITTANGLPTMEFQRWWQSVVVSLETQEALQDATIAAVQAIQLDIIAVQDAQGDAIAAILAAQAAADAANAAAASAQAAADSANAAVVSIDAAVLDLDARVTALEP